MASAMYRDLLAKRRDAGYELFPVGAYDVRVADVEKPTKDDWMGFILQFEVTTGPLAGRKFKNWMAMSNQTVESYPGLLAIWFKEMAALGLDDAFFEAEPGDQQVMDALKGRTARAVVGRRKKKGSDDEVEDIRVQPPTLAQTAVAAPAPDPMAATMAATPVADPNAPGIPPF